MNSASKQPIHKNLIVSFGARKHPKALSKEQLHVQDREKNIGDINNIVQYVPLFDLETSKARFRLDNLKRVVSKKTGQSQSKGEKKINSYIESLSNLQHFPDISKPIFAQHLCPSR